MDLADALSYVSGRHQGVLVTRRRDGRPQLSNIGYGTVEPGVVSISVTETRAKTKNLRRDPAASLYVPGDSFWSYVVVDGTAALSATTTAPDDETADELVALYRHVRGEDHPDWDDYRAAMVREARLVVRLRPTHAYGVVND
ncbi:MAG: PPOX class F420-dependent oxidoreductase [Acidimicrobiales bacterium]